MNPLYDITGTTHGFEVLEEKTSPLSTWKNLKIRGVFQRADAKNRNSRIYPKRVLEEAISNAMDDIMSRKMVGCLDHPVDGNPNVMLKDASHIITELKFQGNDVIGTAVVLDGPNGTPMGQILSNLIKSNVTVGISSRGEGSVSSSFTGENIVEAFNLSTFDIVSNPSTHGAYIQRIEESKGNSIKKALEEQEYFEQFRADLRKKLRS